MEMASIIIASRVAGIGALVTSHTYAYLAGILSGWFFTRYNFHCCLTFNKLMRLLLD